jgi:hypothetical protein
MSDRVEGNIVYTKSPDKVVDVENVLLVRLSGKNCFKKPTPVVHLADVSYFCQGQDGLLHDRKLLGPVLNLLDSNRVSITSVNDTLVVPN